MSEQYQCPICQDAHYVHPLKEDGKPDYSQVVSCRCVKESMEKERMQRMLKWCELPEATDHMTFENWEPRPELNEVYECAKALAEGRGSQWLTVMSDVDRGKTHLLVAICRLWISRGIPARYAYVPLLLEELRRGFRHEGDYSYERRFAFFLNVPLLALDDLGVEHSTPWVQEKLDTIVDYRLMNGLALVVNTNLPLKEMPFRVKSRLERGGEIIYIHSPEYSTWKSGRES